VTLDPKRLRDTLGAPEHEWLVERLRRRLELGQDLTGSVTLADADPQQRRAAGKLLGRAPRPGRALTLPLGSLEVRLRDSGIAPDLRAAVEALTGPVTSRVEVRTAEDAERERLRSLREGSLHSGEAWYRSWSAAIESDGSITARIRTGRSDEIAQAVAVLDRLPASDLPIPVLAEAATGDTKALSATGLERLVLRALATRSGRPAPKSRTEARELWAEAGVVVDDLSSQVLLLGVRARERHLIGRWMDEAAGDGLPIRLTLHQMLRYPCTAAGRDLFVCENPAVMRTAATELGADCAPLICTEGEAFHACLRFVAAAAEAGTRIHWRGDFDWTGIRTTTTAIRRWGATPWRMSQSDYRTALALGEAEPLRGRPSPSRWDPELAEAMTAAGMAVMEERLLRVLLADLAG
jgi:uncharacterized protein (TIGR02679 family)